MRLGLVVSLLVAVLAALIFSRARPSEQLQELDFSSITVEALQVRENVFVLMNVGGGEPGGNIIAHIGDDGVLLVDTQYRQLGEKNLAVLRTLTDAPVEYIVNTHMHIDHIGGNGFLSHAGSHDKVDRQPAPVLAHESVLRKVSRGPPAGRQNALWPTAIYAGRALDVVFNGDVVHVRHAPAAHTDGDSLVHFKVAKVVAAGDILSSRAYPYIDRANGGTLEGLIDGLEALLAIASEPGTIVVPGHGNLADAQAVRDYLEMVRTIRDRVAAMLARGMTLAQIQQARPTADYDARFSREVDYRTRADFVYSLYLELTDR